MKPARRTYAAPNPRRPFTGAWIETCRDLQNPSERPGRPFTGAWIETFAAYSTPFALSRPFTGAWIETAIVAHDNQGIFSRPFTGAWIETNLCEATTDVRAGRPFTGAWIETPLAATLACPVAVAPSRGRGLKRQPLSWVKRE